MVSIKRDSTFWRILYFFLYLSYFFINIFKSYFCYRLWWFF
ncbi:hypothetical protein [Moraxella lacunata]